jgi:hypothetical protein
VCTDGRCVCAPGWVGPHCMAAVGFDDIDWEPTTPVVVEDVFVPNSLRIWLGIMLTVSLGVFVYIYRSDHEHRTAYTAIPY